MKGVFTMRSSRRKEIELLIYIAAMAGICYNYGQYMIADFINEPIAASADPVSSIAPTDLGLTVRLSTFFQISLAVR